MAKIHKVAILCLLGNCQEFSVSFNWYQNFPELIRTVFRYRNGPLCYEKL